MKYHASVKEAVEKLASEETLFVTMMEQGNMRVEFYVPEGEDLQTPHKQDELYIITSGVTDFIRDVEIIACKQGDVLFVPARMEHRFINFSEDFATWVIFYGPEVMI